MPPTPMSRRLIWSTATTLLRSLLLSRIRSTQPLNQPTRYGLSKGFHSSSYNGSAKKTTARTLLPEKEPKSQNSQSWRPFIISAAVLGGLGGTGYLLRSIDDKRAIHKGQDANCGCSTNKGPTFGGPFSLIDAEGRTITEKKLLGNWVLLYFGYTSSPDVGPAELQKLAKALNLLDSKHNLKVQPVFITIDPQRDSPAQLRAYLQEFDSRIMGLTGPVTSVRQMAQEYRVYFKKVEEDGDDYLVEASHNMYLMNPSMEIVRCFGVEYNAEELTEAICKLVEKGT